MIIELVEELKMAIKFDEVIAELKQLDFPCYMEPEGGEPCEEADVDPCDACAARKILNRV